MTRHLSDNPQFVPRPRTPLPAKGLKPANPLMWDTDDPQTPGIDYHIAKPPPNSLNSFLVSIVCLLVLVTVSYYPIVLPVDFFNADFENFPLLINPRQAPSETAGLFLYTAQIPIALWMGCFLGPVKAAVFLMIYLLVGLMGYPLFANGGGLDYFTEPTCGYLLGMPMGAFVIGRLTLGKPFRGRLLRWLNLFCFKSPNQPKTASLDWPPLESPSSLNTGVIFCLRAFFIAVFGVLTVHGVGISYLWILSKMGGLPAGHLTHWIQSLTVASLIYDTLLTFGFILLVRPLRFLLWPVLY